jgi:hypothetical protein
MNKLIYLIILCPMILFAQSESRQESQTDTKAMDQYFRMNEDFKKEDPDALEKILSYRNEVKGEIKKNRTKLSAEQYKNTQNYEKKYWNIISDKRRKYSLNADFLRDELQLLNEYRKNTLDYLYSKISE